MDPGSLPVVRIADDGELTDVRELFEQLGVEWMSADETPERPTALLVATPSRMVGARAQSLPSAPPAAFRIAVADKMTKGLQRELDRARPDFVVTRPFHAAALRLLILHALYVGPERRSAARVALTVAIRFRAGVFSRGATLVELSRGGCRLIAERVPAPGEAATVVLPRELTGGDPLSLSGRIVGADPAGGFEPGEQACSVAFEMLDTEKRRSLRAIMGRLASGGTTLALRPGTLAEAKPAGKKKQKKKAAAPETPSKGRERRRAPRSAYARPVLASSGGAARVLIGRDLSSGGMRVAPDPDLLVGDELKLVVYGPAGAAPLLLRSVVSRDDGADGFVLRFEDVAPEAAAELGAWTARLPQLVADAEGEPGALPSIVSEVVEEV
ncbi:MAG TPA: PilZ domain-containing protein [Myxococcota bacterium]|nr:PilZ domain-containing protein [Myxococcota bacterium]